MRPFKVYFLSNFQTYNTVLLTSINVLYITPHDLFIQNYNVVSFDHGLMMRFYLFVL